MGLTRSLAAGSVPVATPTLFTLHSAAFGDSGICAPPPPPQPIRKVSTWSLSRWTLDDGGRHGNTRAGWWIKVWSASSPPHTHTLHVTSDPNGEAVYGDSCPASAGAGRALRILTENHSLSQSGQSACEIQRSGKRTEVCVVIK